MSSRIKFVSGAAEFVTDSSEPFTGASAAPRELPRPPANVGSPSFKALSGNPGISYITLTLPFNTDGDVAEKLLSTAWLFKVATHRMLNLAKSSSVLPASDIGWENTFRKIIHEVIPSRRYTEGVITLVRRAYESCRQLGVDFMEAGLGDWLMFQQTEKEYPVRSITLKPDYEFHVTIVTIIDYGGKAERVAVKPTAPKNYKLLLDKNLEERQKHTARVVIKDYGVRRA